MLKVRKGGGEDQGAHARHPAHRAEPQKGKGDASGKEGEGQKEGGVSTGLRSGCGEPLSMCEAACSAKKCSPVSPWNPKPKALRSHSSQTHVISDLPTKRGAPRPAHMGTHTRMGSLCGD